MNLMGKAVGRFLLVALENAHSAIVKLFVKQEVD